MLAFAGGILGVLMMVPLRRALIVKEHGVLPYPEGTACAEVLVAGERGGKLAGLVFGGLGIGALWKSLSWTFNMFRPGHRLLDAAHQPVSRTPPSASTSRPSTGRRLRHRPAHRGHDGRRRRAVVAGAAAAASRCMGANMTTPLAPVHPTLSQLQPGTGVPFLISRDEPWRDLARLHPLHRRRRGARRRPDHAVAHAADDRLVGARRAEGLRRGRRRRRSRAPSATSRWRSCSAARCCSRSSSPSMPGLPTQGNILVSVLIVLFGFFFATVSSRITGPDRFLVEPDLRHDDRDADHHLRHLRRRSDGPAMSTGRSRWRSARSSASAPPTPATPRRT